MLDHAFGTLGLHRIALFVFEFNERAIRAYRRCGFVDRGAVARVDLARRPLVGRAGDERPRIGLAPSRVMRGGRRRRRSGPTLASEARGGRRRGGVAWPATASAARPASAATIRRFAMSSTGAPADAARADVRELIAAKGHTVDNARAAVARLEAAFADGSLERTPSLDLFLADLDARARAGRG